MATEKYILSRLVKWTKVKRCASCRECFDTNYSSPANLVLKRFGPKQYYCTLSETYKSTFGNSYYHSYAPCLKAADSGFNEDAVLIGPTLNISKAELEHLKKNGIIHEIIKL